VTGAGCVGVIGGDEVGGPSPDQNPSVNPIKLEPGVPTIHRLTTVQLQSSWVALFGSKLMVPPASKLPADDQLYGFTSISAATRTMSPVDVEKYEEATYKVLEQVWADAPWREKTVGCTPKDTNDPCVTSYFGDFGLRAWRRPLESSEVESLVALAGKIAKSTGDTWEGLRFATASVLQSPHFLFRVEIGEPAKDAEHQGLLKFTSWEMASRLSFLLTDAPPSKELFDAAASGELDDVEKVKSHAVKLLAESSSRASMVRFFRDFMNIGRLDQLDKNAQLFPQFSQTLGPAMRTEIEKVFEATVFDQEGDFRKLFTTRQTFVNGELAKIYGLSGITGPDFVPVTLPADGKRGGLLTSPGFLAMNAHKSSTSPTHRGRFVRISLMCMDVPPPPPGVDTTIPDADPNKPKTLRERLEAHRNNPACKHCHQMMDPIGFGFENFDAIGQWRDTDAGLPVDAKSDIDGKQFDGPVAAGELIAQLPVVGDCVARRFYQHATAHLDKKGDTPALDALVASFIKNDFNFKKLVIDMVVNDGFRYASPPAAEVKP
jgi:hypothetical protein